jgi:hypothetical protein
LKVVSAINSFSRPVGARTETGDRTADEYDASPRVSPGPSPARASGSKAAGKPPLTTGYVAEELTEYYSHADRAEKLRAADQVVALAGLRAPVRFRRRDRAASSSR